MDRISLHTPTSIILPSTRPSSSQSQLGYAKRAPLPNPRLKLRLKLKCKSSSMEPDQPPSEGSDVLPSDHHLPKGVAGLNNHPHSHAGGGNRTGLFRTPISGGVQTADLAHQLPHPALAVRNLMEQARFADLCSITSRMHHRRQGYPFGSFVDFAPDFSGHPIFSFSPLAIHTRNLLADPRCSVLVQNPGGTGLANARVTIFGDVYPLPEDKQEWAHRLFMAKHQQVASQQWYHFDFFRMEVISDIYFVGGFGTVSWVDVKAYEDAEPDAIARNGSEQVLKELNDLFSEPLKNHLSVDTQIDDAALISIDSMGTDVRVRQGAQYTIQRLSFEEDQAVETLNQAKDAIHKLMNRDTKVFKSFI